MPSRSRIAAAFASLPLIVSALASCTSTANVSDAYMALDSNGDRKRTTFFTDTSEIFCVAEFASSRTDVTINLLIHQTARYDFTMNQTVAADRNLAETEIAPGQTTQSKQSLALQRADPMTNMPSDSFAFPAGNYQCEIRLDNNLAKTVAFQIQFAQCPDSEILQGSPCFGFYKIGDQCDKYGAGTTKAGVETAKCTCTTAPITSDNPTGGAWVCDPG